MSSIDPQTQLRAYAVAVRIGDMVQQSDAILAQVKHFLTSEPQDVQMEQFTRAVAELRNRQAQLNTHLLRMIQILGMTGAPAQASQSVASLRGHSKSLALPDVISILSMHRKSGTLRVVSKSNSYMIEFQDGAVVHTVCTPQRQELLLGSVLVALGRIGPERLQDFLSSFDPHRGPIGIALARAGMVTMDDLRDALSHQVRELFHRIFALEDAMFSFTDDEQTKLEMRVRINTTELLLDTARRRDEASVA
jgi:hypothetical protein